MFIDENDFLEHYGVKGMKWGRRKSRDSSTPKQTRKEKKAARKAFNEAQQKAFVNDVVKSVGSRSMSELYAVRGKKGPTTIMTGEEVLSNMKMNVPFTSVQSTGMKINDGR